MVKRVPTGIKGFDKLIDSGLPKGSVTLVSGAPGTGKSIFCLQILYNNALKGKNTLFITFEQTPDKIKEQMRQFGWKFDKSNGKLTILALDNDDPDILDKIWAETKKGKYEVLALDSLASLAGASIPPEQLSSYSFEQVLKSVVPVPMDAENIGRMKVKLILNYLQKSGATVLVTSETIEGIPGMSRDTISEFLCDAVIMLHYLGVGSAHLRSVQIMKMRLTNHRKDLISFEIGKGGLIVKEEETFKA